MKNSVCSLLRYLPIFIFVSVFSHSAYAYKKIIIGVHDYHYGHVPQRNWDKLADHILPHEPETEVVLKVLTYEEMEDALNHNQLDFLLTDPAIFIRLKEQNSLARVISAVVESYDGRSVPAIAGAIITSSKRTDLVSLADLKGRRIAFNGDHYLGAYLAQAHTLVQAGINMPEEVSMIIEPDAEGIVNAILEERVDAGFIRAGFIEQMIKRGKLDLSKLKVINKQNMPGYPYAVSTSLYPNQPLIMLPHVDPDVAQQIVASLLSIDAGAPFLESLGFYRFSIPIDYDPVVDVARELRLPPFDFIPEFTMFDVWQRYSHWIIISIITGVVILLLTTGLILSNRKLMLARQRAEEGATALARSEAILRGTLENSPHVAIQWYDRNGLVLYWNNASEKLYGWSSEEALGKTLDQLIMTTEELDDFVSIWRTPTTNTSQLDPTEMTIYHRDGQEKTILVTIFGIAQDEERIFVCMEVDITDQTNIQNALKASTERFDLAMRASNDGLWDWDVKNNDVYYSPRWKSMLGYEEHELKNDFATWDRLTNADDMMETTQLIDECMAGKCNSYETEFRMCHKEGHWVYILSRTIAVHDVSGKAVRLVGTHVDITERKEAEKTLNDYKEHLEELVESRTLDLENSKKQLEFIIENIPAIFYHKTQHGEYMIVNRRFEQATGFSKSEIVGHTDTDIYGKDMAENIMMLDKHIFDSKQSLTMEEVIKLPDGTDSEFLVTKLPLFDNQNNINGLIGIATDISQVKSLQYDLAKTMDILKRRASLERMVSDITSALIGADNDMLDKHLEVSLWRIGTFISAERAHLIQFNLQQESFSITHQWCEPGANAGATFVKNIPMAEHVSTIEILDSGKIINVPNAGNLKPEESSLKSLAVLFSVSAFLVLPIKYAGQLRAAIGFDSVKHKSGWNTNDLELLKTLADLLGQILNRNETRQALLSAKEEAERLAQVKSEFLANMSHEIRTPLNAVLGIAQIGVRTSENSKNKLNFQRIMDSGQHLYGLVNDILDFSKFEAGKLGIEQVRFNLGGVIDKAINFVAVDAFAKGIDFKVKESIDLPETLLGDPMRFTQILGNLLTNALKFTEQGHIYLEASIDKELLVMRIVDSGLGMTKEQVSRLFKPFEQADSSTTRRFGGTGLGLAISSQLVEMMNGEIIVESEIDKGSDFEIHLPMIEPVFNQAVSCEGCPIVRLAVSSEHDADELSGKLSELSSHVEMLSPLQALSVPFDGCVLIPEKEFCDADVVNAVDKALNQGMQVVAVVMPGLINSTMEILHDRLQVIELPLRLRHLQRSISGTIEQDSQQSHHRLAGVKILAAEDNEINQIVLEDIIANEGGRTIFAENGQLALDILQKEGSASFDLVLMDIQMPVMDGYEATSNISKMYQNLPVIGLTAHAYADEKQRCFDSGMVAHVSKPVDTENLVTTILENITTAGNKVDHSQDNVKYSVENITEQKIAIFNLDKDDEIMDWDALTKRYNGRKEFIQRLLKASFSGFEGNCSKLYAAIKNQDLDEIASLSHAIKGTAGNIMAFSVFEMAKKVEQEASAKRDDAIILAEELCGMLQQLLDHIEAKLVDYDRNMMSGGDG